MALTKILEVVTDACNQFAFTLQILKFSKDRVILIAVKTERKSRSALQMAVTWYDRTTTFQTLL